LPCYQLDDDKAQLPLLFTLSVTHGAEAPGRRRRRRRRRMRKVYSRLTQ